MTTGRPGPRRPWMQMRKAKINLCHWVRGSIIRLGAASCRKSCPLCTVAPWLLPAIWYIIASLLLSYSLYNSGKFGPFYKLRLASRNCEAERCRIAWRPASGKCRSLCLADSWRHVSFLVLVATVNFARLLPMLNKAHYLVIVGEICIYCEHWNCSP